MKTNYLATLLSMATAVGTASAANPNIIFIYADDMGFGDVSALNPDSKFKTPMLDKIAQRGLTFADAHTNSSVSTPSRYGVITGRYAWRSSLKRGVLGGFSPALIERDRPTVASMLRSEGYKTYCIGKWHLGMDGWLNKDGSKIKNANSLTNKGEDVDYEGVRLSGAADRGFDYFYGIAGSLDMPPYLLIENDRVIEKATHLYDGTKENRSPYGRAGWAVKDRKPSFFLSHFTDKVVKTIGENAEQKEPFFIYFALNAPHTPVAPSSEFKGKSGIGDYGDFMMEVDHRISQIYKALEDAGVADNTLVVISSDNGPEIGGYNRYLETGHSSSGKLKGVKRDLWEGGHRVPMFVTWGDVIKRGRRVDQTICMLDFYATAADIVGHKLSDGEAPDSYSYLPLIKGKGQSERDYTIHHGVSGRFAIRKGDWVLIETKTGHDNNLTRNNVAKYYEKRGYTETLGEGNGELFNLKSDPEQRMNLYAKHPEIVAELTKTLNSCRE